MDLWHSNNMQLNLLRLIVFELFEVNYVDGAPFLYWIMFFLWINKVVVP